MSGAADAVRAVARAAGARVRPGSRRAGMLAAVLVLALTRAAAAAVTVSIPTDLSILPGGDVDVPLALTADVAVRALSARIADTPDELALVEDSAECTTRASGFSCA